MDDRIEALRQLHDVGKFAACLRQVRALLSEPEGLPAGELAEATRYAASSCMALSDYFGAQVFAERERIHAKTAGDADAVARAEYHLAAIETQIGDTHLALEAADRFLALDSPPRPSLARYRAATLFNRGTVYMQRWEFTRAIEAFAEAGGAYQELRRPLQEVQCHLEAAWAHLRAGEAEGAAPHLDHAEAMLREHPDAGLQTTSLNHRAFWHFRRGEYAEAVQLTLEVLTPGRPGVTDYHISEAAWLTGECGMDTGRLLEAEQFAALAADRALKARSIWLMNQSGDLRRRVTDAKRELA